MNEQLMYILTQGQKRSRVKKKQGLSHLGITSGPGIGSPIATLLLMLVLEE